MAGNATAKAKAKAKPAPRPPTIEQEEEEEDGEEEEEEEEEEKDEERLLPWDRDKDVLACLGCIYLPCIRVAVRVMPPWGLQVGLDSRTQLEEHRPPAPSIFRASSSTSERSGGSWIPGNRRSNELKTMCAWLLV